MSDLKILFVGASGYIGGSVLSALQTTDEASISNASVSALVRSESQAKVLQQHRLRPILYSGLEDTAHLQQTASQHDIVINCAISYNVPAAQAFIRGLADRRAAVSGCKPLYIHTSGTSSIAIAAAGRSELPPAYSDAKDNIHKLLQQLESAQPYPQRTTDLAVIATGIEVSVSTYIVMPPLVYGLGTGHFNRLTVQEPAIISKAQKLGYTPVLAGSGYGRHNHIHVADLAQVYVLLLQQLLGEDAATVPRNEAGIYFAEAGDHSWLEVSQGVAGAAVKAGLLGSAEVTELTAEEWAVGGSGSTTLPAVPEIIAHSMGSHGLTKADLARDVLGWGPRMGPEAWSTHFQTELQAVLAKGSDS